MRSVLFILGVVVTFSLCLNDPEEENKALYSDYGTAVPDKNTGAGDDSLNVFEYTGQAEDDPYFNP